MNQKWQNLKCVILLLKKYCHSRKLNLFGGSYYNQIDGVVIDSPLEPVLANLLMGYNDLVR